MEYIWENIDKGRKGEWQTQIRLGGVAWLIGHVAISFDRQNQIRLGGVARLIDHVVLSFDKQTQ